MATLSSSSIRCVVVVFALLHVLLCEFTAAEEQRHSNSNLRGLRESATQAEQATEVASFHVSLLNAVNGERAKVNLPPLCMCSQLRAAAVAHSTDMALRNFMAHSGSDGSTVASRVAAQGFHYTSVGENVAAGQASVAAVMDSWMNSPGHRANILNPAYRFFGPGYAYNSKATYCHYWTQNFAADGVRTTCA